MEGLWCSVCHWRTDGDCYQPHSYVVHVYFLSYVGFSNYYLHGACFLDEHEAVHPCGEKKSVAVFVIPCHAVTTRYSGLWVGSTGGVL